MKEMKELEINGTVFYVKGEKGEKGDTGTQGEQGPQGEQGIQGEKGADGVKGDKGEKGDKGDQGEQGIPGKDGKDGKDGVSGIPIRNNTSNTAEIEPNVLNVWGEIASLTITLATPSDTSIVNEYMIQFTSGDIATQLTLPDTITWMSEPTINANTIYQISIINDLAVIGEFVYE